MKILTNTEQDVIFYSECYNADEVKDVYNGAKSTFDKVDRYEKDGYRFVPDNNPKMDRTKKWGENFECVRLAQTNGRSGLCKQTLWAVKPLHNLI